MLENTIDINERTRMTIDQCFTVITNKINQLSSLMTDCNSATFDVLRDQIFADCPINPPFDELSDHLRHWKRITLQRIDDIIKKNERKYLGIWGSWEKNTPDNYPNDQQVVTFSEFTGDNGYSEEDIKNIDKLSDGEMWRSPNGNHILIRLAK